MAYCKGKGIEKQRGDAVKEVIYEKRCIAEVARRFGRARSTIYRWMRKWREQNPNFVPYAKNDNHPSIMPGKVFKWQVVKWDIPTTSSAPKSHPNALSDDLVRYVIATKRTLRRSNYIVWLTLQNEGIGVSFSSVCRIIAHHHLQRVRLYGKKYHRKGNIRRPEVKCPGDLVEVDTVYLMNYFGGKDLYITNVIDLYSRAVYSEVHYRYDENTTARTVLNAQRYLRIRFKVVQCDNGREFRSTFHQRLAAKNIKVRHTRPSRPNDNAHIERFNRTMRDELIGPYTGKNLGAISKSIKEYLIYYNYVRIHTGLGMTPMEVLQR